MIKLDPKNTRLHSEVNKDIINKSLTELGAGRSIVIDSEGFIVAGNGVFEQAKKLGLKTKIIETNGDELVVIKRTDLKYDDEKRRKLAIADNATGESSEWNYEELELEELLEWGADVVDFPIEDLDAIEDDFEVPDEIETDIVLGDIIEIGEHRLLCGDSTCSDTVAKLMNGEKADMVFTDPPYNINYEAVSDKRDKIANDNMSDEDFTQFLYDALNINCDTFYVCCSWQFSHLFRKALDDLQKPVKSFIVWNKVNPAQHLDKYFKQHEIILYHGKFGGQKTLRGDVWEVKRERNTVHPTMKPISLIEMALNDNKDKKNVYDAFLGSGSTMVAAHQLKRKCYGMELDPKYCQVIIDRMINLDDTLEIKLNGKKYKN